MDAWGRTAQGCERTFNDTYYVIADLDRRLLVRQSSVPPGEQPAWRASAQGKLFVVAQGASGLSPAHVASRVALEAVVHYMIAAMPWAGMDGVADARDHHGEHDHEQAMGALVHALVDRDGQLGRMSRARKADESYLSPITVGYVVWPSLYLANLGDNGSFLLRAGHLHPLTPGASSEPGAPRRGRLARRTIHVALGRDARTHAEVQHVPLREHDRLLLCTHGMAQHLDAPAIQRRLGQTALAADACDRLLAAARAAGATDNATVLVCRFG